MAKNRDLKLVTGVKTVDGEQQLEYKTYPYPIFVKGGIVKRAVDLASKLESQEDLSSSIVDDMADFVVDVYGNQFTRDELIDGTQAHELMEKLSEVLQLVMTGEAVKGKQKEFIQEKMS